MNQKKIKGIIVIVIILFLLFVSPNGMFEENRIKGALEKKYNTDFEIECVDKEITKYTEKLICDGAACEGPTKISGVRREYKITQPDEKIIFYTTSNSSDIFDLDKEMDKYRVLLKLKEILKENKIIKEEDIEKIELNIHEHNASENPKLEYKLKTQLNEKLSIEMINDIVDLSVNTINNEIFKLLEIYDENENYIQISKNDDVLYVYYNSVDLNFGIKKNKKENIIIEAKTNKKLEDVFDDAYADKIVSMYANFKNLGYSNVTLEIKYDDKRGLAIEDVVNRWTGEKTTYCSATLNSNWEKKFDEQFEKAFERWKQGRKYLP